MPLHIIETDFEPDDAMAILAHNKTTPDRQTIDLVLIIGESEEAGCKLCTVRQFMSTLPPYKSIRYCIGTNSGAAYPKQLLCDEYNSCTTTAKIVTDTKDYIEICLRADVIYMLKPPREAMQACKDTNCMFKNTTVHAYGGFNWRSVAKQGYVLEDFTNMMNRYGAFYYYDTFTAIGENNSGQLSKDVDPIYESAHLFIERLIFEWNNLILRRCQETTCEATPEEIYRKQKIINNIAMTKKTQFVMADVTTVLCERPTKKAKLAQLTPYPKWESDETPDSENNTFIYGAEGTELRRKTLIRRLAALFKQ